MMMPRVKERGWIGDTCGPPPGFLVCTVRETLLPFQCVVGVFLLGLQACPF